MSARVGSPLWLLRHELRLAWRGIGGKGIAFTLIAGGLLSAAIHATAFFLLHNLPSGGPTPPWVNWALGAAAWLGFSLMLSQAIAQSVSALFDRGDLDLLLASPLPTQTVFIVRGLGIALSVVTLYLFLLAPVAHMGLFTGHPSLMAIYPALAALALGATAAGLALTLLLVRTLGARKARTVAQVFGALIGALMFLASQVGNLLGREGKREWAQRIADWTAPGGPLGADSPLWFPGRALGGEPLPLLAVMLAGGGAFWLVVRLAHRRFLAGTQESVTGSARRGAPASGRASFGGGLARVVLVKEWRLIRRDPQLITQTLLQLLYLTPLALLLLRSERGGLALAAPGVVWLAASLANSLAWITMAAEDAPELLGTSPNATSRLRRLKLLAAVLPVWLLLSPLAVVLALKASLLAALIFLLGLLGGTVSLGLMQLWVPRQGKRGDMKNRSKGNMGVTLLELLVSLAWAGATYCLLARPLWTPLPLALALLGLGTAWLLGRGARDAAAP